MPITAGAFPGRDMVCEVALAADETATLASLSFNVVGMMRGKSLKITYDKIDTTGDSSEAQTRTGLVTFKMFAFEGDGVAYVDAVHNQKTLRAFVVDPGLAMNYQPKLWIRLTDPDGSTYVGPFIATSWEDGRTYDAEATWKWSAESNGQVTLTTV